MMNGDPNQTSTKLRNKALEIIREVGRPMASHEIANWIREHDLELADLLKEKCSDYVRIILSVTQDSAIVKYKSLTPIPGVDKRSTFYGLSDQQYRKDEWIPIQLNRVRSKRGSQSSQSHRKQGHKHGSKSHSLQPPEKQVYTLNLPKPNPVQVTRHEEQLPEFDIFNDIGLASSELLTINWDEFAWHEF